MSNLNRLQFEQHQMFVPTETIVNEWDKGDSVGHRSYDKEDPWSPRDQWEEPNSKGFSLRQIKLGDRRNLRGRMTYEKMLQGKGLDPAYGPPQPPSAYHVPGRRPQLDDGHHRLAHLQAQGHTEIPMMHGGPKDPDFYNPRRPWRYR